MRFGADFECLYAVIWGDFSEIWCCLYGVWKVRYTHCPYPPLSTPVGASRSRKPCRRVWGRRLWSPGLPGERSPACHCPGSVCRGRSNFIVSWSHCPKGLLCRELKILRSSGVRSLLLCVWYRYQSNLDIFQVFVDTIVERVRRCDTPIIFGSKIWQVHER